MSAASELRAVRRFTRHRGRSALVRVFLVAAHIVGRFHFSTSMSDHASAHLRVSTSPRHRRTSQPPLTDERAAQKKKKREQQQKEMAHTDKKTVKHQKAASENNLALFSPSSLTEVAVSYGA